MVCGVACWFALPLPPIRKIRHILPVFNSCEQLLSKGMVESSCQSFKLFTSASTERGGVLPGAAHACGVTPCLFKDISQYRQIESKLNKERIDIRNQDED